MTAVLFPMHSPASLKRLYEDADLEAPKHHHAHDELLPAPQASQPLTNCQTSSSTLDLSISNPEYSRATSSTPSSPDPRIKDESFPRTATTQNSHPLKRRKLTSAEKEIKQNEKNLRDQQKAEEKARKEESKRVKDEEKRIKEESLKEDKRRKEDEKEEKRKMKEVEKTARDMERRKKGLEKKAKDDERTKKERSQLRLNTFFAIPAISSSGSDGNAMQDRHGSLSRRGSVASIDGLSSVASSRSASIAPEQPHGCEYDRRFPPFFVQSFTNVAPTNRFFRDEQCVKMLQNDLDTLFSNPDIKNQAQGNPEAEQRVPFKGLLYLPPHKRRKRYQRPISVKEIIAQINETPVNHVYLNTSSRRGIEQKPVDSLKATSLKYLRFAEDVRPPYIGTYTKLPPTHSVLRLCRRPFTRALPAMNYDYDSEAEWEDPGEGEDLDSEGEEDIENDEEADDMDGFLDDEDENDGPGMRGARRRHIMGDIQPIATGLCWEPSGETRQASLVAYGDTFLDLRLFKLDILLAQPTLPIDPYSTSYWPSPSTLPFPPPQTSSHPANEMPPPRLPLHVVNGSNTLLQPPPSKPPLATIGSRTLASTLKQPKKPLPPELLKDFKNAIEGSDLTKAGLVEVLKKQFPKTSKDTIKDSLALVAERRGDKEADKRWYLKD